MIIAQQKLVIVSELKQFDIMKVMVHHNEYVNIFEIQNIDVT